MGNINYFRARMAFEMPGTLSVAREVSSAICHLSGKTHRALVTDFDNTIWGGEVAERRKFWSRLWPRFTRSLRFFNDSRVFKKSSPPWNFVSRC